MGFHDLKALALGERSDPLYIIRGRAKLRLEALTTHALPCLRRGAVEVVQARHPTVRWATNQYGGGHSVGVADGCAAFGALRRRMGDYPRLGPGHYSRC